jgi:hypothetical protein
MVMITAPWHHPSHFLFPSFPGQPQQQYLDGDLCFDLLHVIDEEVNVIHWMGVC